MGALLISISKLLQPETQDCNSGIFVFTNDIFYKPFEIYVEMKTLAILLLTAIVAIEKEQCSGKYLLVEIDDAEGRVPETRAAKWCRTSSDCSSLEKCCYGICVSEVSPCEPINKSTICENNSDCGLPRFRCCCYDGYCGYCGTMGCRSSLT